MLVSGRREEKGGGGADCAGGSTGVVSGCWVRAAATAATLVDVGTDFDSDVGSNVSFDSAAGFDFLVVVVVTAAAFALDREDILLKICEGTGWFDVDDNLAAFG